MWLRLIGIFVAVVLVSSSPLAPAPASVVVVKATVKVDNSRVDVKICEAAVRHAVSKASSGHGKFCHVIAFSASDMANASDVFFSLILEGNSVAASPQEQAKAVVANLTGLSGLFLRVSFDPSTVAIADGHYRCLRAPRRRTLLLGGSGGTPRSQSRRYLRDDLKTQLLETPWALPAALISVATLAFCALLSVCGCFKTALNVPASSPNVESPPEGQDKDKGYDEKFQQCQKEESCDRNSLDSLKTKMGSLVVTLGRVQSGDFQQFDHS